MNDQQPGSDAPLGKCPQCGKEYAGTAGAGCPSCAVMPSADHIERTLQEGWADEDRGRESKKRREEHAAAVKKELDEWSNASILTRRWKIGLASVLFGFLASAVLLWFTASNELLARIQTFNGALTIPVGALTWAFAFTFVFLVPMKAMNILMCKVMKYNIEVSERMLDVLESADEQIQVRAERMEGRWNNFLDDLKGELDAARRVAEKRHGTPILFESFLDAMKEEGEKARKEIKDKKESTEDELDAALAEGEREAAEISGDVEIDFEVLYELAPFPSDEKRFRVRAGSENEAYVRATHELCFKHGSDNVRFPKFGAVVRAGTPSQKEEG